MALGQLQSRIAGRTTSGLLGRYHFAHGHVPVSRIALVNHLVTLYRLERYLEIGVRDPRAMFDGILAPYKVGVDPDPGARATHALTSDDFFAQNTERFDIVFIDGLHIGEQVERDIENALAALNPGGMILLHDLNPPTAFHARLEYEVNGTFPQWNGTSWEGFAAHRRKSPHLEMYVVDTDWGVGFVRVGRQILYDRPIRGYEDLARDRQRILNLITVRDFLGRHPVRPRPYSPLDRLF